MTFDKLVWTFVKACQDYEVKALLVGGGAVNFHGYQRHSADVDFWIDVSVENLDNLKKALRKIEVEVDTFPDSVKQKEQNISIKISPLFTIELITRFNPGKSFNEAWNAAVWASAEHDGKVASYKVLHLDDLVASKLLSGRPKDRLDIQELQRRRNQS